MKAPHPAINCGLCLQPTDEHKWRQGPEHIPVKQKRLLLGENNKGKLLQLLSTFWFLLWDLSENSVFWGAVPRSPSVMNRQKTGGLEVGTSGLKHQISSV